MLIIVISRAVVERLPRSGKCLNDWARTRPAILAKDVTAFKRWKSHLIRSQQQEILKPQLSL